VKVKGHSQALHEVVGRSQKVRSHELSDAKVKCMDREQWRNFVNGAIGGMSV